MRSILNHRRVGQLAPLLGAVVLLAAACTDGGSGSDVRSPAPTGSLTPASSAEASPSVGGDVVSRNGGAAGVEVSLTTP